MSQQSLAFPITPEDYGIKPLVTHGILNSRLRLTNTTQTLKDYYFKSLGSEGMCKAKLQGLLAAVRLSYRRRYLQDAHPSAKMGRCTCCAGAQSFPSGGSVGG